MKTFFVILLYYSLTGSSSGIFWPCSSNTDCTATGSICSEKSATCQCEQFDFVLNEDYTECVASALLGETCSYTAQCNLMPTGASCSSGKCACSNGRKYVHGQCRVLKKISETCSTDLDCDFGYERGSVQCNADKVCACAEGYYRRNGNICRRKSMEINDACVVDEDCQELKEENVGCVNFKCTQKIDTSEKTSETTFIDNKSSGNVLKKDQYTQFVPNGNGSGNELDSKYALSEDSILSSKEIAVQTSFEILPPIKSLSTPLKYSSAKSNWTFNKYRYFKANQLEDDEKSLTSATNTDDDVEKLLKYGSACVNNGQPCEGLPHSFCSNNVCICSPGYYRKDEKCYAELGELAETAEECAFVYDAQTKKCGCRKNFFYEENLRGCRKPIQFKLSCTADSQCSPFGAATCKPEIPRRCTCAKYSEYDEKQQLCVYKSGLGALCQTNEGCPVENSICLNNTCTCNKDYLIRDNKCVRGSLYATCNDNTDCNVENSECQTTTTNKKMCDCRKGYVHFGNDQCLKEAEVLEDTCVDNEQCAPLLAKCVENKCKCSEDQHFLYGQCNQKKALDEVCIKAGECYTKTDVDRVECRNSICKCKLGYSADTSRQTCIRTAPAAKSSSGRPSALKIITFALIGSAFFITTAALKQAYYY